MDLMVEILGEDITVVNKSASPHPAVKINYSLRCGEAEKIIFVNYKVAINSVAIFT
jgi:hypothetical protein